MQNHQGTMDLEDRPNMKKTIKCRLDCCLICMRMPLHEGKPEGKTWGRCECDMSNCEN